MDKKKVAVCIVGLFCAYKSIASIAGIARTQSSMFAAYASAIGGAVIAAVWALFAAFCVAYIYVPRIGDGFINFLYFPLRYLKEPPEKIAVVKGLIAQEKYPEAIATLNEILVRKPCDIQSSLLLVEIYMDRLHDKNKVAELVEKYFQTRILDSRTLASPENVEMLMRYSDICLEQNRQEAAIALFESELRCADYSVPEKKVLTLRLGALIDKLEKIG